MYRYYQDYLTKLRIDYTQPLDLSCLGRQASYQSLSLLEIVLTPIIETLNTR